MTFSFTFHDVPAIPEFVGKNSTIKGNKKIIVIKKVSLDWKAMRLIFFF
jgi:hypothetical protein